MITSAYNDPSYRAKAHTLSCLVNHGMNAVVGAASRRVSDPDPNAGIEALARIHSGSSHILVYQMIQYHGIHAGE
jgi:hypothetical protein